MPDGKRKAAKLASKAKLKGEKKKKAAASAQHKAVKQAKRSKDYKHTEDDLLETLAAFKEKWEADHRTHAETVGGPPSKRVNASFVACPVSSACWLYGGEWLESDDRCHFYGDLYRFTPEKNEWRVYTSPNSPGPRSAHQLTPTAGSGGKLWLFGGEFAALNQSAFHHYRDFWCFDIASCTWERLETRIRPSARSGHRMCAWRHLLVLFGGFQDTGVRTQYLGDLWVFDTHRYEWKEIITRDVERRPGARSGFSLLPTAEGVVLHGGYKKDYIGKRAVGVALDDTWSLHLESDDLQKSKWERRKRGGYGPSLRSGASMTIWSARSTGILFGGVFDDDKDEETLDSTFFDDMYGYQLATGRWSSLQLRRKKPKALKAAPSQSNGLDDDGDSPMHDQSGMGVENESALQASSEQAQAISNNSPCGRYNAMLAVQRNTLYLYGGILESRSREAALEDFWTLDLAKLDEWKCLRAAEIIWDAEESDYDDRPPSEEESEYSSYDEELPPLQEEVRQHVDSSPDEKEQMELRRRANAFLEAAAAERSEEDRNSTPLPGESLRLFYERTRQYWTQKAHGTSDNRGKLLRRDGFQLCDERYEAYKPILQEIERIREHAGLDDDEAGKGPSASASSAEAGVSRNRR